MDELRQQRGCPPLGEAGAEEALVGGAPAEEVDFPDGRVTAPVDGVVGEHQGEINGPGTVDGDEVLDVAVRGDGDRCLTQPRVLDGVLDGREYGAVGLGTYTEYKTITV